MSISIEKKLRHPDVQVRRGAVLSLLQSDRPDKKETLEEFLLLETNARLQFMVRRSLNSLQKQSSFPEKHVFVDQIKKDLSSSSLNEQQNAARSIAQHNLQEFLPDLLALGDRSPVFSLAALHLMRKDAVKYFDKVRAFLRDKNSSVIMRSIEVLIEYRHTSALILCLQYLSHSEPKIKNFTKRKLIQLGHEQLKVLFEELISKNEPKLDQLVFHSILNLRLNNALGILNTLKTRADGEFLQKINHILKKLEDHIPTQSNPVSASKDLSPLELKFRQTKNSSELIVLIRSLDQVKANRDLKIRLLMRFLAHPEAQVRVASLETLVPLAPDNLVTLFQQFLQDEFPAMRATAILALGQHPEFAPIYKDEILLSLQDMIQIGSKDALLNALTCIGNLADENLIPLVRKILAQPKIDLEIQDTAHEVLKYFDQDLPVTDITSTKLPGEDSIGGSEENQLLIEEKDFIIKLEEALLGDDRDYKISLLKGLAEFEVTPYAETVTQLLYRLQQFEEDPKVLALMLRNLGLYQFKDSSDFLLEYLKHPHVEVKAAALKSLAYYNDSRVLISFMELLNESWSSDKQLKLIDEIIDFVFVKRPDLGLAALEKLGKKGRSQEERLKNWLNYCQSSSWPTIQIINTWYDYEFSENFLDFITALICQLLTIWNFDDIAPLLLKNPHQKYKDQFIKTLKELKPSFDPIDNTTRKLHKRVQHKEIENENQTPENLFKEDLLEASHEDEHTNIVNSPPLIIEDKNLQNTNQQNKILSVIKFIPYVISVITGTLTTLCLYMLIVSFSTESNESDNLIKPASITFQNLTSEDAKFSDKVTFLGQKSINLALFNWNGYSLIAKLSSPQWLPFDINDLVILNGSFQGKDKLGNFILSMHSFSK